MTKHSKFFRSISLQMRVFITIFLILPQLLFAQPTPTAPLYIGGSVGQIAWSNDGQNVAFIEKSSSNAVELPEPEWMHWIEVDAVSQSISTHTIWPFQPTLTQQELKAFAPQTSGRTSFIYESPNHRYLVFARGTEVASLTLADRQTNQAITVLPELHILSPDRGPDGFKVHFSADSTAFTVTYEAGFTDEDGLVYVSGYAFNLSDAFRVVIGDIGQNLEARYRRIEDLSEDGKSVLITGLPDASSYDKRHLYQWDASSLQSRDVTPAQVTNVKGAAFSPQTEDRLLMVTEAGLISYNHLTDEMLTVRDDITSDGAADKAYFSPIGEYVLLSAETESHTDIYVFDLRPNLLPTLITPTQNQAF